MGDEPEGFVMRAEQCELDMLRGRAYAEDADIFEDVSAVSRLRELEDRLRLDHFAAPGEWTVEFSLAVLHARSQTGVVPRDTPPGTPVSAGPPDAPGPRIVERQRPTSMRWHEALVASTAGVTVLLAAWAWTGDDRGTSTDSDEVAIAAAAADRLGATTYAALYDLHLESLREELLSGPGMEEIGERLFRGLLRPQGMLYGRAVGAGPTRDREFCMVVADTPTPAVACLSTDDTERTLSVILPPASADSSERPPPIAEFVRYTLTAAGIVVAEPVLSGQ